MHEEKRKQAGEEMVKNAIEELRKQYTNSMQDTEDLNKLRKGEVPNVLRKRMNVWMDSRKRDNVSGFSLVDPIYGAIFIEDELAKVFLQPIFQRLNSISQLSFAYFKYPTATHTRLSHCVGVAHNTEQILTTLFKRKKLDVDGDTFRFLVLQAKIAALLHDLGHGPFGHALDKYAGLRMEIEGTDSESVSFYRVKPDKYLSLKYIGKFLSTTLDSMDYGLDSYTIQSLLDPAKKKTLQGYSRLVSDAVDSSLDADRMDYLVRDAHLTGIPAGRISATVLHEHMVAHRRGDAYTMNYTRSSLPYIEHFLYARQTMYTSCYEDDTKLAAEGMLIRAVEDFMSNFKPSEVSLDDIVLLTDGQLLDLLIDMTDRTTIASRFSNMLRQQVIFEKICEVDVSGKPDEIKNTEIKSFREGVLIPGSDALTSYLGKANHWSELIGGHNHKNDVIVVPPYPETFDDRELNTEIIENDGSPRQIRDACLTIKAKLELWNKERLKIRVFVNPELPNGDKESIRDMAKKVLGPQQT